MKTYKKIEEKPRLVIEHDENPQSPRGWDNLGYFITIDRRYHSPDNHPDFEEVIKETGEIAKSQENHIDRIKKEIKSRFNDEKVLAIFPVVKYEHSGVVYRLGTAHGFDYSNNGFYIVTKKSAEKIGTKKKDFERVIKAEIDTYNKYVNGEIYCWTLYNEQGEVEDSGGDYYDLEDIKDVLPKEWKGEDLSKYVI